MSYRVRFVTKDGSLVWNAAMEEAARNMDINGKPGYAEAIRELKVKE